MRQLLNETLGKIIWHDDQKVAPLLSAAGFVHGFGRKGEKPEKVKFAKQVHGTTVLSAEKLKVDEASQEGDGVWSQKTGERVAIRTADCLPVLFGAQGSRPMVSAVHAGWRGLTAGILREAKRAFSNAGFADQDIHVAIGPAISTGNFEVGPEVMVAAKNTALGLTPEDFWHVIQKGRNDRWHFDLQTAAALSLVNSGIAPSNIEVIRSCTFRISDLNSFRREGKGVGSNWSWIECQ